MKPIRDLLLTHVCFIARVAFFATALATTLAQVSTAAAAVSPDAAKTGAMLAVALRSNGKLCLRASVSSLVVGNHVTVVSTVAPIEAVAARIVGLDRSCAGSEGDAGYRISLKSDFLRDGEVAAVVLPPAVVSIRRGTVSVSIPGRQVPLTLRSCESADGVHLTAWAGQAPRAERVWHEYVYLGQDLDPDCTNAEME